MKTRRRLSTLGKTRVAFFVVGFLATKALAFSAPRFPGYQLVQAQTFGLNRMTIAVSVNGQPENFVVDTGCSSTMLAAPRAERDGVTPTDADPRKGRYSFKDQTFRTGMVGDLRAGSMDFGVWPIMLFDAVGANFSFVIQGSRWEQVNGTLGADLLLRYKAIIDTRAGQIFFQTSPQSASGLTSVAGPGFTRVPLHEDKGRGLTVDCTLNGKTGRLLVDTGALNTHLNAETARAIHLPSRSSRIVFTDSTGERHPSSVTRVRNLRIGNFVLPEQEIFVVDDAAETTERYVGKPLWGLLGEDVLARQHGIIDLAGMSLFLK